MQVYHAHSAELNGGASVRAANTNNSLSWRSKNVENKYENLLGNDGNPVGAVA